MSEKEMGVTADAERLAAIRARLEAAPQDLRWGAPALLEDIAYLLTVAAERDVEYESLAAEYAELSERHERLWEENRSLRARIEAALRVDHTEYDPEQVIRGMRRELLAGDQPEATPEPPKRLHGAEALHEAGEAAIAFIESLPLSEPPHLDPLPWVEGDGSRFITEEAYFTGNPREFDPRPADENGKPYSTDPAHYGVTQ